MFSVYLSCTYADVPNHRQRSFQEFRCSVREENTVLKYEKSELAPNSSLTIHLWNLRRLLS